MNRQLHIILLEDNASDAALVMRELRTGGLDAITRRAHDKSTFLEALEQHVPDLIIADYALPGFDGLTALKMARERFPHVPGIMVSGTIGEERAVEALKSGATDYVLKDRLNRLIPVVQRALRDAREVSDRKQVEAERDRLLSQLQKAYEQLQAAADAQAREAALLRLINEAPDAQALVRQAGTLLRDWFDCDAVGIRWRKDDDYPYAESSGFPEDFVVKENSLCTRDTSGRIVRDTAGNPVLECMCGNVLQGRFDPSLPFFTPFGSFWTNSTTRLLATSTEADRQARTRNRCNGEGYESVALVPLRFGDTIYGLLQLNGKRPDRFTPEAIEFLERIAGSLAVRLAQHETQVELAESELRYRTVGELLPHGTFMTDPTGKHLYLSPSFLELVGKNLSTLAEDGVWTSILHPGDVETSARLWKHAVRTGAFFANEYRVMGKDGHYHWILCRGIPMRDEAGEIEYWVGVNVDIGELKATQEALTASEERQRLALEAANEGLWDWEPETDQVYFSPRCYSMLGYEPGEFEASLEQWECFIHPEDLAMNRPIVAKALAGGRPDYVLEYRVQAKDGQWRWILSRARIVERDAAGVPKRVVGTLTDITDRREAEDALRDSEGRYRSLFDSMLNGFALCEIILDETGKPCDYRHLEMNEAFEAHTGLRREAVMGRTVSEVIPDLEPWWIETFGRVALTGEPARFEHYLQALDRWLSALVYCPKAGQFASIFEDVTERHQVQQALRETSERLSAVISSSPVAIYMCDRERGVQLWNPAAERMFGWSEAEVLGGPMPPIIPPGLEHEFREVSARVLDTGETITNFETKRLHRDGMLLDVSGSIAPLYDADGRVTGFIGVISDLTERLRAQHEFEERTALDKLVQVTQRILAATTPQGLLQRTADGARELIGTEICSVGHGYEEGGFRVGAVSRADHLPPWPEAAEFAARPGGVYLEQMQAATSLRLTDEDLRRHPSFTDLPNGHLALRGFLGSALAAADGEPTGMIMVSRKTNGEFTARDEALLAQLAAFASLALQHLEAHRELTLRARELAASNRELEAFSYSVSHDLRAPLRAIDGFSQAILTKYAPLLDERGQHYFARIRTASQRLGELIDDLLQLSRVSRDPMRWEQVDLSALAETIVEQLRHSEPERAVKITIEEGLVEKGHPTLLHALLLNLLGNAWKFTSNREAAVVEFGRMKQGGEQVYFVRDNGAGFDMRYIDKLFIPFQRLHTLDEFPGNGVGLATVQRVINRHGGRVWAEGTVGHGATFYFTLAE